MGVLGACPRVQGIRRLRWSGAAVRPSIVLLFVGRVGRTSPPVVVQPLVVPYTVLVGPWRGLPVLAGVAATGDGHHQRLCHGGHHANVGGCVVSFLVFHIFSVFCFCWGMRCGFRRFDGAVYGGESAVQMMWFMAVNPPF